MATVGGPPYVNNLLYNLPPPIPTTPASVSSLFNLISTAAEFDANAKSQTDISQGNADEASAYTSAGNIARANARLALVGGDIEQAQRQVKLGATLGSQRAAVAAGGFANSGTALSLLRSSTQQGLLDQQVIGMNASLKSGGYEAQSYASDAEAAAARSAATSATDMAAHAKAMSAATKTYATNTAADMNVTIPNLDKLSSTTIPSVSSALHPPNPMLDNAVKPAFGPVASASAAMA